MARIPFPSLETMTPAQRQVHDTVVSGPRGVLKGPLRAALHNAALADRWQKLGELLRYQTSLPARHTELAILVTARSCDCPFEWIAHVDHAREGGVPEDVIESVRQGRRPDFAEPGDAAVFDYAWELHEHSTVGDTTYARIVALYDVVGVVELTALIGYYTMVAMTLNAHAYDLPEGVETPFPAATAVAAA